MGDVFILEIWFLPIFWYFLILLFLDNFWRKYIFIIILFSIFDAIIDYFFDWVDIYIHSSPNQPFF